MIATELSENLGLLTKNLLFLSESDYPFEISILNNFADLDLTETIQISLNDFLQNAATHKEWHNSDEKSTVLRYQDLLDFIEKQDNIIGVYKTKPPLATIYLVLQSLDNQYIILSTKVVET